ncbi:MAG TPA: glycosyltransferase [Phycisphaerales bacterium]|nr:glycosyltransferase [Phycisphaerales bacterium]
MKISIGMLAYNEAQRIDSTIRCVFAQTLLREPPEGAGVELVIVPNGCKDATAEIARASVARELAALGPGTRVTARVEELPKPGKSNAWNEYVHRLSDQSADLVFLLDSDITFNHERCLRMVLDKLLAHPEAHCAVGRPLKDAAFKEKKSLLDRLSLLASRSSADGPATIAGSMYVVRGPFIRRVWMPAGLLTEDGFIRAMIITDLFTRKDNPSRIVREERASQIFEAVRSPVGVFKHSKRLLVGARINACVYDKLWNLPAGEDAGSYCKRMQDADPDWLKNVVRERTGGRGWWVMQPGLLFKRLNALKYKPAVRAVLHAPVALAIFPFDLAVLIAANNAVRRGEFRW